MFHKEVQITDAIIAVILVEASLQGDSSLLALNDMNADFPENPTVLQSALSMVVLEKLDLLHLLEINEGDKSTIESVSSGLDDSGRSGGEEIGKEVIYSDSENSSEQPQTETESEVQSQKYSKRNNLVIGDENNISDEDSTGDKKSTSSSSFENIVDDEADTNSQILPVLHKNPIDDGEKKQSSNVSRKLEIFRFKPREVDVSDDNAGDINQMLNMLPSVAGDFNVDEMDLADIDISEQSFTSDD